MPAEPERTVLASIPDVEDRELRVSLVSWPGHPEFGTQLEIADYIPSRDLYARGHLFDAQHAQKVLRADLVRDLRSELAAQAAEAAAS